MSYHERQSRAERRAAERAAKKIPRREFLGLSGRAIAIGGGLLATGGIGLAVRYITEGDPERTKVDNLLREYRTKEAALTPVIERFEQGFTQFSQEVVKLIDTKVTDMQAKRAMLVPFELARINLNNSDKNFYSVRRKELESSRSLSTVGQLRMDNPNYFYYEFLPDTQLAATFTPFSRTFGISASYDPNNKLDNLIAAHELDHVGQDNVDRKQLPAEVYERFANTPMLPGVRSRIVGNYEATAYIHEIEMLNMLTNGAFFNDIAVGNVDGNKYVQLLNAQPGQKRTIEALAEIARHYKASRSTLTQIDGHFLEFIRGIYERQGNEVYHRTPKGFILMR